MESLEPPARTPRHAVIDKALNPVHLNAVRRAHATADFRPSDINKNYDSLSSGVPEDQLQFLRSQPFAERYAELLGLRLRKPGRCKLKFRKNPTGSKGFWIHSDVEPVDSPTFVFLLYLNAAWRPGDGGELQLWRAAEPDASSAPYRWKDYLGKEINFLDRDKLLIEASGVHALEWMHLEKSAAIFPVYNRAVVIDLQHGPAFHSVTPNSGQVRDSLVAWFW